MPAEKTSFPVHVTHIGTATALIELDNLTILTDPYFSPAGTVRTGASGAKLSNTYQPAMGLEDLPPVDLVLLSHEDHKDNLDDLGRELLNGRRVVTTVDGSQKLAPRKGVQGLLPWQTTTIRFGALDYEITATPCVHLPGGECTGFVITTESWGATDSKPNALYFSGDTIYIEELAKIKDRFHVSVALFNVGKATVPKPGGGGMLQITMDGEQAVRLRQDIDAEIVVPMHFEGWGHFKEGKAPLEEVFKNAGVEDKFKILKPGHCAKIA